jgi:PAS domain S-box-containing protein
MSQTDRLRRTLLPVDNGNNLAWRLASTTICLISLGLIFATAGYRVRAADLPSALLSALVVAFCAVMLLLSRFLFHAYREQHHTATTLDTARRTVEAIYENAIEAILILGDDGTCLQANPAAEQLLGTRLGHLIGRPITRFYKSPTEFKESWNLLRTRRLHRGVAELVAKDHSVFVEYTAKADCLPGQHLLIFRDITEQRRAQLSLLESEQRFQQMARNIQEIFWMIDAETKDVLYVNEAYETVTGRSCESLRENPSSYRQLIYHDDRVHVLTKLAEGSETGYFDEQFRIVYQGREVRWVWVRAFPVRDGQHRIRRVVGTALDITAQKQAEDQVVTNLTVAKAAWAEAEALRGATLALTQDLRMNSVMDTLLKCLAEIVPYSCARVFVPEGGPHVLALAERLSPDVANEKQRPPLTLVSDDLPILRRLLRQHESILLTDTQHEKDWHTFTGHSHLRSWLSVPLIGSEQYLGFLSIGHVEPNRFGSEHLRRAELLAIPAAAAIQNARLYARAEIYGTELEKRLTDLRQTQNALAQAESVRKASEEKFQKVFRHSPVAFSITTLEDGRFVDVNAAFEERYGYSRDHLIGRTADELGICEDPTGRAFMVSRLEKGGSIRNVITRLRTRFGEIKVTAYSADRIVFDGCACVLAVSQDVAHFDPRHTH